MAYRAPRYSYVHAARDVGATAISLSTGAAHADYPIDNLIDDRAGTIFKWAASETTPSIIVDLGAETGIDRLIIPANHNLESIRISQDTDVGFPSSDPLTDAIDVTPGVAIDIEFDKAQSEQFLRLRNLTSDQFYLSQLYFTKINTLATGPDLANSADGYRANVTRLIQNTGLAPTVLHGPQQRVMEYNYAPIDNVSPRTDLAKMEALIAAVGMDRPFFVDPASFSATPAADDPPIWMKFDDMPESRHTVLVPMSNAESKEFSLRLIESLD
jgi:hypothetical protein